MNDSRLTEAAAQLGLDGLESFSTVDQAALLTTLRNLLLGFQRRDAGMLGNVYTADAHWVNAFGSVKKSATEIVDYLRGRDSLGVQHKRVAISPLGSSRSRLFAPVATFASTSLRCTGTPPWSA